MKYLLPIFVLLTACAPQKFKGNDPGDALRPFVESFYTAYTGPRVQVQYNMIPLEGKSAECIWDDKGKRIINVNSTQWEDWCPAQKKALVWHEMGHCVLGRAHTPQAELSYMKPVLSASDCQFFIDNEQELDNEMFNYTGGDFNFKGICVHQ